MSKKFSIIILSYNTKTLLMNCLNSVFLSFDVDNCEIIVVDNASSDNTVAALRSGFGDKISIIENHTNLGFGAANNIGARAARGDFLFFLKTICAPFR